MGDAVGERSLVRQKLSSAQKAAVLLASLDSDVAAEVMQALDPEVMSKVVGAIRNLGVVPGAVRKQAIAESLREMQALSGALHGNDDMAATLLGKVVGADRAASMLAMGAVGNSRFGALAVRSPDEIFKLLGAEQTSMVALVLRYLPPKLSSDTLAKFSDDVRSTVMVQMATARLPAESVIDQVETHLTARLPASDLRKDGDDARLDSVVSIIQRLSKAEGEKMLAALAVESAELADAVRDRLFTFEDLGSMSDEAVRRVIQELESGVLSKALRKAPESVINRIHKNMSRRAAEALEEEMGFSSKIAYSEVRDNQKKIVAIVRRLADQGEIKIGVSEEEYV